MDYPIQHTGACIVAGNAFNLMDDLVAAKKLFPDAPILAVNGASQWVYAFALFSYHPQRFMEPPYSWINKQRSLHSEFTVHGAHRQDDMPFVDYWWEGARGKGGSAWGARKVAKLMGFDTAILCGCPLVPGNYHNHKLGLLMTRKDVVDQYAAEIASDADWHEGAYSMSGATREILGAPC